VLSSKLNALTLLMSWLLPTGAVKVYAEHAAESLRRSRAADRARFETVRPAAPVASPAVDVPLDLDEDTEPGRGGSDKLSKDPRNTDHLINGHYQYRAPCPTGGPRNCSLRPRVGRPCTSCGPGYTEGISFQMKIPVGVSQTDLLARQRLMLFRVRFWCAFGLEGTPSGSVCSRRSPAWRATQSLGRCRCCTGWPRDRSGRCRCHCGAVVGADLPSLELGSQRVAVRG
jgi:hypothetical protein